MLYGSLFKDALSTEMFMRVQYAVMILNGVSGNVINLNDSFAISIYG
jgi:hypothetical protein